MTMPTDLPNAEPKVLVLACGNPARLDDGLGPALASRLERLRLPSVHVDAGYQWNVEDAYDIAQVPVAVLVDASVDGPEPFFLRRVEPSHDLSFTSHSITPETLLGLAVQSFGAQTELYVLGIRGYSFDRFGETLSVQAENNLTEALRFLTQALSDPRCPRMLRTRAERYLASNRAACHASCRSAAGCRPPGLQLEPSRS